MIVCDNGTQFTSNAVFTWANEQLLEWHYIMRGKPMQNSYVESFNSKMLDETLLFTFDQAREAVAELAEDYNTTRLHSSHADLLLNTPNRAYERARL